MSRFQRLCISLAGLVLVVNVAGDIAAQQDTVANSSARPAKNPFAGISTKRVATGFHSPVFCTAPPGDTTRLFILQQSGQIEVLSLKNSSVSTFLDISSLIVFGGEQGLLGLAFHPKFASNGKFYVNYTGVTAGETHVVEYHSPGSTHQKGDPASARSILTFSQPQVNHNGGWLGFGPDGYLYISTGDGGNANDTGPGHTTDTGNAQDITDNFLGKMLRIDVNGDDFPSDPNRNYAIPKSNPFVGKTGDDEIWAYGLRNPWRNSFDRKTGDLYIGDVGQAMREEVNFQPRSSKGGENYGWRLREGTIATPTVGGPAPPGAIDPVYDYAHGSGTTQGNAVVGGYVYRGPIIALNGTYFFADYVNPRIWSFRIQNGVMQNFMDWTTALTPDVGQINHVTSFGEDARGNLYLVDYDGDLFQIVKTTSSRSLNDVIQEAIINVLTQPPSSTSNQ